MIPLELQPLARAICTASIIAMFFSIYILFKD